MKQGLLVFAGAAVLAIGLFWLLDAYRPVRIGALFVASTIAYFWLLRILLRQHRRNLATWYDMQREFSMRHPILSALGIGYEKPMPVLKTVLSLAYLVFLVFGLPRIP